MAEIDSREAWEAARGEYRRQLAEMLGLDPMPPRTPLKPEVTGIVEDHGVVVEKLHFQSLPGLYVTANLYRPPNVTEPLPTILYVCGHARAVEDGVSLGGKTSYHHHGVWFARNGYVCLVIDTIQLGEIEGIHHGTYRYGMWWWNNRGYSSAGVEAWNGIRALDYLETRPEVDPKRFGITGRSGGGAYSWWVAALDERIAAAVPVAGITSLHNHVVDGCVEGHCDCMYMVNTYRWDFPLVAALVAPRPLLISNTDKDRIFPLEGVVDVHQRTRRIYRLLGAEDRLGLQITEGPHKDTQELHIHAFRWFNRFLRDTDELIDIPAEKVFEPKRLQVFDKIPEDELVTSIHETFVPAQDAEALPDSVAELERLREEVTEQLATKTFGGWPAADEAVPADVSTVFDFPSERIRVRGLEFTSEAGVRLPLLVFQAAGDESEPAVPIEAVDLFVLNEAEWNEVAAGLQQAWSVAKAPKKTDDASPPTEKPDADTQADASPFPLAFFGLSMRVGNDPRRAAVCFPARGIGPTDWGGDERAKTQIRRRFMLLGQTQAGMRVWDIRRAVQTLPTIAGFESAKVAITAVGDAAVESLHASLFEPTVTALELIDLPATNREGPDFLNVSRFVELPTLALLVADDDRRLKIRSTADARETWQRVERAYRDWNGSDASGLTVE
ncbi:MAG: acetylxylan esterase [Planctomycetaceae bacterium]|nr:MAG: acetylxylan esterase [Planctomycetaceae bacterium]